MWVLIFTACMIANSARAQPASSKGQLQKTSFTLGEIHTIESTSLSETRTLNVYLPAGYSNDSSRTYPVIYLLDGSANEDFIHVAGLVQFYTLPWINRFPKSIVVGIANIDRKKDFTFSVPNLDFLSMMSYDKSVFSTYGGSEKFMFFIEHELQPFIEHTYKVNSSRTIIGQSLGGLIATEMLLKKSHLFDTYIILSPSLWWNKESLLRNAPDLLKNATRNNLKVYVGVGNEGRIMKNDAKKLARIMRRNGSKNLLVYFDYFPDEIHETMIHQALYNAFKTLYPKDKGK